MAYDGASTMTGSSPSALPPIGKLSASRAREFLRDRLYSQNPRRREDMLTIRRADLYQQCAQWLQRTANQWDTDYFSGWTSMAYDPTDPLYVPRPVINVGFSHVQNEIARLSRPDYQIEVTPRTFSSSDISASEAALVTKRLMDDALRKMQWDKIKDRRSYHMPVYGGYWIRSYFDQTYDNTTVVPTPDAVECPACGFQMASPTVTADHLRTPPGQRYLQSSPLSIDLAPDNRTATFNSCPECAASGTHSPMEKATSTSATPSDPFGRGLTMPSPVGTWRISIPSPYDIFPRDLGIGISWGQQAEWCECHVETIDWIALRYPQKARQVVPERADMLDYWHPLTAGSSRYSSSTLFKDSVRVKEFHKAPWMEWTPDDPSQIDNPSSSVPGRYTFNRGRSFVMAGDVLLFDGPFLMDSLTHPGETVPRIHLEYVPWEIRDGGDRLQGLGLWELLFDPQDIINETVSQRAAHRQRLAVSTLIVSKDHNLAATTTPGIPGRTLSIEVDPQSPTFLPRLLEGTNTTIDPGVDREEADMEAKMGSLSGKVEVEQGQVPGQVTAAVAIQTLKGYTSERREPRIRRIKESDTRVFRHGALLLQAMTIDPVEIHYTTATGQEAWAFYQGTDMAGQTEIDIKAVPDFEEKARVQQLVTDMVNAQQIDLTRKGRIVAKIQDAPAELFEDEDRQTDTAKIEWYKLRTEGRPPRIDPMLDDHQAHMVQHGLDLMSSEGRALEEISGWDSVLKGIGGAWEQISQMAAMQVQMMPRPGVDLQDAIFNLWMQAINALTQAGAIPPSTNPDATFKILTGRAHLEAHRLTMQMQQMQAMQQPMPAAPGGAADASGNVPSPASPNPAEPTQTIVNAGVGQKQQ